MNNRRSPHRVSSSLHQRVLETVAAAWGDGCPVAGQTDDDRSAIVSFAIRRFQSFGRRGVTPDDLAAQIRDLARALIEHLEPQPDLVGPLKADYEHLASLILNALHHDDAA